ncbi:TasA family protein [Conexibacter stalactiti]|uniref:TasA family protein n=1 Tax=Conexibacter stalactiti TaxID=1940611 RepID=A0ABU4HVA4_9ACTN|nr:TasA family protein [Conexibacter stalactiti]MDW5595999.1 TasA family protein [Conexibacter stalactiti]MEC5036641.1 TasA family protein [Conexibacter stalactiti]
MPVELLTRRRPRRTLITVFALACAVIVGAGIYGTFSAFTSTAANDGNSFAAGVVDITDDDTGSAIVPVGGLTPGDSVTRCVNVRNAGSIAFANVALSGTVGGSGLVLANALTIAIDRGSGAAAGVEASCAGFAVEAAGLVSGSLSAFPGPAAAVDDRAGWQPGAVKSYRMTVALPQSAPNAAQGQTATLTVRWNAAT